MTTALERDLKTVRAAEVLGLHKELREGKLTEASQEYLDRVETRWSRALVVVEAVVEIRRIFGDAPLPLLIIDALRAFEEDEP